MRAQWGEPRIPTGSRGGFARGRESGPSAFAFAHRAFSLGRPGLTDERRRYLATQESKSGSDTAKEILKTRMGVVRWADAEGPYMRGKESTLPLSSDIAVALANSYEAETELGEGCLPSPNQRRCPRYRRARRE